MGVALRSSGHAFSTTLPGRVGYDGAGEAAMTDLKTEFVRHMRPPAALTARVDGRNGRGVILSGESAPASGKEK